MTRLASFPDYLLIYLKKFTVKEDWTPIKLDVAVEMPDTVDLNFLRGSGLQPGEKLLPDGAPPPPVYDTALLNELTNIGFPPNACRRALYFTENSNIEAATDWLMEHISDFDYDEPFIPPGVDIKPSKNRFNIIMVNQFRLIDYRLISGEDKFEADQAALEMVMAMGFTREQAMKALKATDNNLERAVDWIFSHQTEIDAQEDPTDSTRIATNTPAEEAFRDGSSRES